MTLFPEMIESCLNMSILKRASQAGHIKVDAVQIRDFAQNKHQSVDDYPYGGGAGMLMMADPVYLAYEDVLRRRIEDRFIPKETTQDEAITDDIISSKSFETISRETPRVIYMSPLGKQFSQEMAQELSKEEELIILCGHYEGIDERVLEEIVTDYVSIGDYVVTGGEMPAMILVDAVSRLIPGVLHNDNSTEFESFQDSLLEYPQYTRPEVWHDKAVPEILLSGHHANIEKWRRERQIERTAAFRPDLLDKAELNSDELKNAIMYLSGEPLGKRKK
jgi:tRNA (guanine37-N1)-methyltransferase